VVSLLVEGSGSGSGGGGGVVSIWSGVGLWLGSRVGGSGWGMMRP